MSGPMRPVVRSVLRGGRAGLGIAGISINWWDLTLDCGHEVERPVRYEKGASGTSRGWARLHHPPPRDKMLPAPKRARCELCHAANRTVTDPMERR